MSCSAAPHRPAGARLAFLQGLLAALLALGLPGCSTPPLHTADKAASAAAVTGDDLVIVAIDDLPETRAAAGGEVRGAYSRSAPYAAGSATLAAARALAQAHGLQEVKAWSITALQWRCMLYRLPPGRPRAEALAALSQDRRVRLAQALHTFETYDAQAVADRRTQAPAAPPAAATHNDPYLPLQTGFAAINAGGAQQLSRGEGVKVAVIDTHVDAAHPDLKGRVTLQRDFVGRPGVGERHGTEVAGVIAAVAGNGLGIAGIAPSAQLLALRGCWAEGRDGPARCNSFTLAQSLAAAIAAGADIINLSLGGPHDPLLQALAEQALARGIVLVAALPPQGRRHGFPSGVPGVVVVASPEGPPAPAEGADTADLLFAPGRQVLTLAPGGGYDYASGSSMAAAHASGAVALLRAHSRRLEGNQARRVLASAAGTPLDACQALLKLNAAPAAACYARPADLPFPAPSAPRSPVRAPVSP